MENIKNLIGDNKEDKVLKILTQLVKEYLPNKQKLAFRNELILHQHTLNEIKKNERLNLMSQDELRIMKSKLNHSILNFIDELEKKLKRLKNSTSTWEVSDFALTEDRVTIEKHQFEFNYRLEEMLNLNFKPSFYFWVSEGKTIRLKNFIKSAQKIIKEKHQTRQQNLFYYIGLYNLQNGEFGKAKLSFYYFFKYSEKNEYVIFMSHLMLGKIEFYLGNYVKALQYWEVTKKIAKKLPEKFTNYHFSSILWRENLLDNQNTNVRKTLYRKAEIVGKTQRQNIWFSEAYADLLEGNYEESLASIDVLKKMLKTEFKQPIFMAAALFLEARVLSQCGEYERMKSLAIISGLKASFSFNWNAMLFIKNLKKGYSFNELVNNLSSNMGNIQRKYIKEEIEMIQKSADFRYIFENI